MKNYILLLAVFTLMLTVSGCGKYDNEGIVSPPEKMQTEQIQSTSEPTPEVTPEPTAQPTLAPTENYESLDNKGTGWGFKKIKGCEPDIYNSTKEMFRKYNTYYMDETRPKALYLTFDEGYENGYTSTILDTLKKCGVKAAFFVTGPYLNKEQDLVRRMIDEGHIVGNHTVNHPNLPKLKNCGKMAEELNSLDKQCYEIYGIHMNYMRPPEGEYSERVLAVANDLGYKTIFWSFAYMDWDPDKQRGADYAYEQVVPYFHDGEIILLHAVSKDNTEALERIITEAKNQGYEFRSLDELQ